MEVLGRKEAVEQKENVAVGGGRCIVLSLGLKPGTVSPHREVSLNISGLNSKTF